MIQSVTNNQAIINDKDIACSPENRCQHLHPALFGFPPDLAVHFTQSSSNHRHSYAFRTIKQTALPGRPETPNPGEKYGLELVAQTTQQQLNRR